MKLKNVQEQTRGKGENKGNIKETKLKKESQTVTQERKKKRKKLPSQETSK